MILYHGSNIAVERPELTRSRRSLDFGMGFYLTSDEQQAASWAKRATRIRRSGEPTLSVFDVDREAYRLLNILYFPQANADWLRFVVANRREETTDNDRDVVVGPVANDQTIRTINDYMTGRFSEEIAIQLLLPQKLKDQFAFKTIASIETLRFREARGV